MTTVGPQMNSPDRQHKVAGIGAGVGFGVRRLVAAAVCAVMACAAPTGARAQLRDLGTVGAGDSMLRELRCPPRALLVGFNMRTGRLVDAIQPICDEVTPSVTGVRGRPVVLDQVGGTGGGWQQLRCWPGHVVVEVMGYVDYNIRGNGRTLPPALNHIRLGCARIPDREGYHVVTPSYEGSISTFDRMTCQPGFWMVGVLYGSDAHRAHNRPEVIDSLGRLCARLPAPLLVGVVPELTAPGPVVVTPPGQSGPVRITQTYTVRLATDVYDSPGVRRIGVLQVGDRVTLRERCRADNWCRFRNPQFTDGWVYSGPDYNSLGR
jgi:hypothetical protein